ncbi:NAD(P)H-dependent oxidoreductase [Acuticoccus sp. I52.16.1]|uniref:NAD(P)H-dependent oxidoreductase n=1 Tax=Acuticoccus sp. I52.16.1 TaxID=2928472 RepID=UPI001FD180D0|nr:Gfo/Idh/MocA family oxidoreductase [Acuticoccus sp. I52.16.1]UOM37175.1 Gfo/Idh/MocA family oxidoreductase [Acuticoccus sp. I52.16.1]
MFLYHQLVARAADRPVRVCLIGAGKFGSMFLSQVPTTPGLEVTVIADLRVDAAKAACRAVGWDGQHVAATHYTDDARTALARDDVDVVIEATGHPSAGVAHARAAFAAGKHVVMVNVEADVLAGVALAREARAAGVVYSMAYGDQPALVAEMVEWARCCGFTVAAAGKGTKHMLHFHQSTPDTVWTHYNMTDEAARKAGMNPKMFNSFVDGTKSGIEMAAIANACDLGVPSDGLLFPASGAHDLAHVLRPKALGGVLEREGITEVVTSMEPDGRAVMNDLRWGVYVVVKAPNDYAAACFRQYGMPTDSTGQFAAMYRPFHMIGLELNMSVLLAGIEGKATGSSRAFTGDAVACAKRDLAAGETLDGEGGYCVWGKLIPAERSLREGALPIGLAQDVTLTRPLKAGEIVGWSDVALKDGDATVAYRRAMEDAERPQLAA